MKTLTRTERINNGLIWSVYFDGNHHDGDLFEGTRAQCLRFIKSNYSRQYKRGEIRLAKTIWEKETA